MFPVAAERETQVVADRPPEAVGLLDGEPVQSVVVSTVEPAREPTDVRRFELLCARDPGIGFCVHPFESCAGAHVTRGVVIFAEVVSST